MNIAVAVDDVHHEALPTVSEAGALIELALNGAAPVELTTNEKRSFLEDGDTVALRGYCEKPGFVRIGFGEWPGRFWY